MPRIPDGLGGVELTLLSLAPAGNLETVSMSDKETRRLRGLSTNTVLVPSYCVNIGGDIIVD
jgi:hypothetical protein